MSNVQIYVIHSLVPIVSNNNSVPAATASRQSQNSKNLNNKITFQQINITIELPNNARSLTVCTSATEIGDIVLQLTTDHNSHDSHGKQADMYIDISVNSKWINEPDVATT